MLQRKFKTKIPHISTRISGHVLTHPTFFCENKKGPDPDEGKTPGRK